MDDCPKEAFLGVTADVLKSHLEEGRGRHLSEPVSPPPSLPHPTTFQDQELNQALPVSGQGFWRPPGRNCPAAPCVGCSPCCSHNPQLPCSGEDSGPRNAAWGEVLWAAGRGTSIFFHFSGFLVPEITVSCPTPPVASFQSLTFQSSDQKALLPTPSPRPGPKSLHLNSDQNRNSLLLSDSCGID